MPLTVADGDFAVGAEIDEGAEFGADAHAGGEDAGQDIRADKAAEAAQKRHPQEGERFQPSSDGGEALLAELRDGRGTRASGSTSMAAEEVVHDGVADDDDFNDLSLAAAGQVGDDVTRGWRG